MHDVIAGFTRDDVYLDTPRRMRAVGLQAGEVHTPVPHGITDAVAFRVSADATHEIRRLTKCLEMPGDVEGRPAEHALAVREPVE